MISVWSRLKTSGWIDYLARWYSLVRDLQVSSHTDVVTLITSQTAVISGWSETCRSAAALMWWRWLPRRLQWSQAGQRLAGQQLHWCDDVDYLAHCSDLRLVKDLQVNSCTDVMTSITSHTAVISGWSKTCRSTAALMWWSLWWINAYIWHIKTSTQNLACSQYQMHAVHTPGISQAKTTKDSRTNKVHNNPPTPAFPHPPQDSISIHSSSV